MILISAGWLTLLFVQVVGEHLAGIELLTRAILLNPNCAAAYSSRELFKVWDGRSDTAIADFEQSMHLSPRDPYSVTRTFGIALAHYNAGRYGEAANWAEKSIKRYLFHLGLNIAVVCCIGARFKDAQKVMQANIAGCRPICVFPQICPAAFVRPSFRMKFREALLKAGMPE